MKLWVFKQNDGEVILISEERGRGKVIIYSLNKMGVVERKEETWEYVDSLKAQSKLFYITTIRTLRVSEEYFKLKW